MFRSNKTKFNSSVSLLKPIQWFVLDATGLERRSATTCGKVGILVLGLTGKVKVNSVVSIK